MQSFIEQGVLLEEPGRAAKVRRRAPSYQIVDVQLYKRSFDGSLLKCLLPGQAQEVMDKVHSSICSAHQGANTLSWKILVQGYYWPSMVADCKA